jgi:hypothetical protein
MTQRAFNPAKDDALLCIDRMRPAFQKIIHGFRGETLLCAMTTAFGELLRARGGSDEPLKRAVAAFTSLPAAIRKEVPDCQSQIKAVIAAVKKEGFTLDAMLWSMLGALVNLFQALDFSEQEIDAAKEALIMRINEAQRVSIN